MATKKAESKAEAKTQEPKAVEVTVTQHVRVPQEDGSTKLYYPGTHQMPEADAAYLGKAPKSE